MSTSGRRRAAESLVPGGSGVALRGALLIALAVVLGIALLANSFDTDGGAAAVGGDDNGASEDENGGSGDDGGGETSTSEEESPPATHANAEVRVLVLNGSGGQGVARAGTERVIPLGFTTSSPGNFDAGVPASVVYAVADYEGDAANVATALGLQPSAVQPMPTPPPIDAAQLADVHVLAILGPDFQVEGATTQTTATGN